MTRSCHHHMFWSGYFDRPSRRHYWDLCFVMCHLPTNQQIQYCISNHISNDHKTQVQLHLQCLVVRLKAICHIIANKINNEILIIIFYDIMYTVYCSVMLLYMILKNNYTTYYLLLSKNGNDRIE